MHGKLIRFLAAILVTSIASTSIAFAEGSASATRAGQFQNSNEGQSMMGGVTGTPGMMGGQGAGNGQGMMAGMNAMARMANTCNAMMQTAMRAPASPGKPVPGPSHN